MAINNNLCNYFWTLQKLKFIQIVKYIELKFKLWFGKPVISLIVTFQYKNKYKIQNLKICKKSTFSNNHFVDNKILQILNHSVIIDEINWHDPFAEKLWMYNLHYFDFLLQSTLTQKEHYYTINKELIIHWIDYNQIGIGNGWEPYPISLRVVNWIFFYLYYQNKFDKDEESKDKILNSLYQQCKYLTYFLEYHLLANHLFKNGKALFIAGLFFNQKSWLLKGYKILHQEIKEQILPDGGHFERSPMYHSITLEDILDLINFIKSSETKFEKFLRIPFLENIAYKMLIWLSTIIHPDNKIPLIGDSAFKIAPNLVDLCEYYEKVTGNSFEPEKFQKSTALTDSGYYTFRSNDQFMIVDGGELGVRYQPGHAHCDLFSFEYSYNNTRIFVDSGIGNYLKNELRQNARSTKGHNTVMINNMEQGEIWAAFRMGRGVFPGSVKFVNENDILKFSGIYENNINRKLKYKHKRDISFYFNKFFIINDSIEGKNIKSIESYFHLAPRAEIVQFDKKIEIKVESRIVYIFFKHCYSTTIEDWFYTPEFGKIRKTKLLIIKPFIDKMTCLSYIISPVEYLSEVEKYIKTNWNIT